MSNLATPRTESPVRACWCGEGRLVAFSDEYFQCSACQTLVSTWAHSRDVSRVTDDDTDFYGREYWYSGQARTPGLTSIDARARTDLVDRCPHWIQTLLRFKRPPSRILELGSSHGGFVAMLRAAGFDAVGLELSPSIVSLAQRTFDVPMLCGPLKDQAIRAGSLDAVVLMDVLEHLEDPLETLRESAARLTPDGILVIQTPEYPGGDYRSLTARSSRFLEMLKPDEHLFLFNRSSLRSLLHRISFVHHTFELPVFSHYDMFVVAGRSPLSPANEATIADALCRTSSGRLVQALLDIADQRADAERRRAELVPLAADVEYLKEQLAASEADRAARLEVIHQQAERIAYVEAQWNASEQDRAARLDVINALGAHVDVLRRDMAEARVLLDRARQGSVLRLARTLRPNGVDAALARATAVLDRTPPPFGASNQAAAPSSDRPLVPGAQAPAEVSSTDRLRAQIRDPKTTEPFDYTPTAIGAILRGLAAHGFHVEEITIDPAEYRAYFEAADYTGRYPDYYSFNLPEKSLEHFLAAKLLDLGRDDVYIDIASEHSPVPEIYSRLFGCVAYRQDLTYPEGVHGDRIGGDAAAMPVGEGFATKMALHCSFEHFEGDDERFIREIKRVLRPHGRVCFAPLYLWHRFGVLTDPAVAITEGASFDPDAVVYCREGWGNGHGRLYDPANLDARIRRNLGGMHLTLYRILNATEIHESCYLHFAAIISRP